MATEDIDKACATTIKVFDNKPFNNKSYGLKTLATFTKVNKEGAEIEKKNPLTMGNCRWMSRKNRQGRNILVYIISEIDVNACCVYNSLR